MPALVHSYLCESTAAECAIYMKFGIYYPYWEKEWGGDAIGYIERVKRLGFDVLEVATADFAGKPDDYFTEMRKAAEYNGILLTGGYGPSVENNIGASKPDNVRHALEFYKRMFEQMELAGIRILGGALYSYWPVQFDGDLDKPADFERSVAGMQKLAEIAADHGIILNMESLNRFEGYLINTCQECVDYVDAVNKPNVKVSWTPFI